LGKIAASTGHPPFGLIFWQLVVCILVLGALTLARGKRLPLHRKALEFYVVVAFLGTLIPNYTFYVSVARLPSGIMSIIIATIPLMAFPIAMALGLDRFSLRRMIGILLGLSGVLLIVLPQTSLPDRAMVAFLPIAMIGPFFYALENTYVAARGTQGDVWGLDRGACVLHTRHAGHGPLVPDAPEARSGGMGADCLVGPACLAVCQLCLAGGARRGGLCLAVSLFHHRFGHCLGNGAFGRAFLALGLGGGGGDAVRLGACGSA
jgi:drug/metabolite transporter (DMT)-like permease